MRKFLHALIFMFAAATLGGQEPLPENFSCCPDECCDDSFFSNPTFIEAKAALFFPLGKRFKDIYSKVEFEWGGEVSYEVCDCLQAWLSVNYLSDKGRSTQLKYRTTMELLPIGLGLKYLFPCECINYYVGGGFQYTYMHNHDHSPYAIHHINKWDWGLLAKGGALIPVCDRVFVDLFTEYSYLMMSFRKTKHGAVYRHRPNLSSISVGLGIAYQL